jgi:hypothetical protein
MEPSQEQMQRAGTGGRIAAYRSQGALCALGALLHCLQAGTICCLILEPRIERRENSCQ